MRFSKAVGSLVFVCGCAAAAHPAYPPGDYDSRADIFDALDGFHTFDGQTLLQLLHGYGLDVSAISISTVEQLGPQDGDRAGDVVYDVYIEGMPTRKLPCGLNDGKPVGTHDLPDIEEFIRRKGGFPLATESDPNPTGPILFWAATGRCSRAY